MKPRGQLHTEGKKVEKERPKEEKKKKIQHLENTFKCELPGTPRALR